MNIEYFFIPDPWAHPESNKLKKRNKLKKGTGGTYSAFSAYSARDKGYLILRSSRFDLNQRPRVLSPFSVISICAGIECRSIHSLISSGLKYILLPLRNYK